MLVRALLTASAFALAACQHGGAQPHAHHGETAHAAPPTAASATTTLIGSEGTAIGTGTLVQGPHGVLIRLEIGPGGLPPGWHGVHFHEKADCSDVGAFQLSGGHHGKAPGQHGLMNPEGPEAGDIPNLWAAADGSAGYEAFTTLMELAPSLEGEGISLVVHAQGDDHITQPIGGAGARIACGVIERSAP